MLPANSGGVIVRTVGEDVTQETFKREISTLIQQWKKIKRKSHFQHAPALVHRETSLTRGLIRDLFSTKIDGLLVDSKQVYNEIIEYLKGIAPELIDRVKLYEDTVPIFDKAGIEPEIRDLFKRRCDLPSGGYLIIEQTEALVSRGRELGALHRQEGPREDDPQDEHRGRARGRAAAPAARHRRHHRVRLHRHGDEGEPRQGAAGAAHAPLAATARARRRSP